MPKKATGQTDRVEFGSEQHMQLLGLRRVEDGEEVEPVYEGFTLIDPTQWGPNARPEFIRAQLTQRVSELRSKPQVPVNSPKMWTPSPLSNPE